MNNDLLGFIQAVADNAPPPSGDPSSVLVAIIGAVGIVLAAVMPVVVAQLKRRHAENVPLPPPTPLPIPHPEHSPHETFLIRLGYKPDLILTGYEDFDGVRIE